MVNITGLVKHRAPRPKLPKRVELALSLGRPPTNAEYLKWLRIEAKANGKCGICRKRSGSAGRTTCDSCLHATSDRMRKTPRWGPGITRVR